MRVLIRPGVYSAIEKQYRSARPVTPNDYQSGVDEEDAITGAMMKGLQEVVHGEADGFVWSTHAVKLRGRGAGALEKQTGADVIVEIEVRNSEGDVEAQKGLLGQAKTDWRTRDVRLERQARRMEEYAPGSAVVIDYTLEGAMACRASEVIQANGRIDDLPDGSLRPLGELLADDFLSCDVGRPGMTFDRSRRQIVFTGPAGARRIAYPARYHLLTSIKPASSEPSDRQQTLLRRGQAVRPVGELRDHSGARVPLHPGAEMIVFEHLPDGYLRVGVRIESLIYAPEVLLIEVHPDDIETA